MSCDTEMFRVKESSRCAVVFTLSKAHSCLELHRDKERNHVTGSPFRLLRKSGIIWKNFDLRKAGIAEGSIIVVDQNGEFVNSTKEKMEISTAYCEVADAFPDKKRQSLVLGKRAYRGRPDPTCSLKRNKLVIAFHGRIDVRTRSGTRAQLKRNKLRTPLITNRSYRPVCEGIRLGSGTEDSNQALHPLFGVENQQHTRDPHLSQVKVPPADEPHCSSFAVIPTDLSKLPAHIHPDSKEVYPMKSKPRGIALIINNEVFSCRAETEKENLDSRHGSEKDVKALKMLFEKLYFKVTVKRNLGREAILKVLDKVANEDHSAHDCFVLCIMSHGLEGLFFGSDGETLPYETVFDIFSNSSCRTLRGKPKLFFIQACRGHDRQTGVVNDSPLSPDPRSMAVSTAGAADEQWKFKLKETIPDYSDVLVAYSTINGYVSYRHHHYGSRFVRCLVKVFKEKAGHEDILSMLTMVNDRLVKMGDIGSKQVAQPAFTLTKKLFFWPGL